MRKQVEAAETALMNDIACKLRTKDGVGRSLEITIKRILQDFAAKQVVLAVEERQRSRSTVWEAIRQASGGPIRFTSSELHAAVRERYFFPVPAIDWCVIFHPHPVARFEVLLPQRSTDRPGGKSWDFPDCAIVWEANDVLIAVAVPLRKLFSGRLFLVDPQAGPDVQEQLGLLKHLVNRVAPFLLSAYVLQYRTQLKERAHLARELHDGVIQSLIALEVKADLLRRSLSTDGALELGEVQRGIREQISELRWITQKQWPLDFAPEELGTFLGSLVQRFERETRIRVNFVSEGHQLAFPRHVCGEVGRIVQEALANVQKHSGAQNVLIQLRSENRGWKLTIDDDGRGFDCLGDVREWQPVPVAETPASIRERVRSIRGKLTVRSGSGRGAHLQISIPTG